MGVPHYFAAYVSIHITSVGKDTLKMVVAQNDRDNYFDKTKH